ncbi:MAG: response regulator transcription factor [Actinobacteria bacterium]|nr:response regulator transcription factor [Actinomycetota bacterium]
MTSPTLLVVEDDSGLRDVLCRGLRSHGFTVRSASDGRAALRMTDPEPDAVVLDVGLPDGDGRDVCAALRARGVLSPVLFLTARTGVTDRLSGFAAGGDDYLAKPFHLAELVARIEALLRRPPLRGRGGVDDLELEPHGMALRRGEQRVPLSPTEFRLLARVLGTPDEVVRRRDLLNAGWPDGAIVSENTLDQYAGKLRRRLRDVGSQRTLTAVRGVGYRLS